ncbi:hypothetical protein F4678DRAFT_471922 [Xylaria arbuscula]|nr:hypothetical protein F4678DRAFT_471922 [Xylaria arbuscula]
MADPLSIASGAIAVITATTQTVSAIYKFIRDCKEARADLTQLTGELSELNLILELIRDENAAATKNCLPDALQTQIQAMLTSCTTTVQQIENTLTKCRGKSGPLRWTTLEKERVMALKSSLEAFKSGLSLALETVNLSMTREIKHITETIQDTTLEIKRDTNEILEEIYKLRDQLPPGLPSDPERFRLEQWLDNLTHYAETVVADEGPDEVSDEASFIEYIEERKYSDEVATSQSPVPTASNNGAVGGSSRPIAVRRGSKHLGAKKVTSGYSPVSPAATSGLAPPVDTQDDATSNKTSQPTQPLRQPLKMNITPTKKEGVNHHKSSGIPIPYHVIASVPCYSKIVASEYCTAVQKWATLHEDRLLRFWSLLTGELFMTLPVMGGKFRDPYPTRLVRSNAKVEFCPAMPRFILIQETFGRLEVWNWEKGVRISLGPNAQELFSKLPGLTVRFVPQSTLIYAFNLEEKHAVILDLLAPLIVRKVSILKLVQLAIDRLVPPMVTFISESEVLVMGRMLPPKSLSPWRSKSIFSSWKSSRRERERNQTLPWQVYIVRLHLTANDRSHEGASISLRYSDAVFDNASVTAQYSVLLGFASIYNIYMDHTTRKMIVTGARRSLRTRIQFGSFVGTPARCMYALNLDTGSKLSVLHADAYNIACEYHYAILGYPKYEDLKLVRMEDGSELGTLPRSWECVWVRPNMVALWRHVGSNIEFALTAVRLDKLAEKATE